MKAYIANYLISMVEHPQDQEFLLMRLSGEGFEEEYKPEATTVRESALYALALQFIDRPFFTFFGVVALIYMAASLISKLFV
jgi:hypothetical protein